EVPTAPRPVGEVTMSRAARSIALALVLPAICGGNAALAQDDSAGMWSQRFHEELPERGAGPEIGDYAGLPVNDAARLRADSWDAAKWTLPARQCDAHPRHHPPREAPNLL